MAEASVAVHTHCPYCALQCGMTLRRHDGGPVEVLPRDFPTNRGGLCQKGWTAADLLDHPERLTTPLVRDRRGAPLRPADWDEAMGRIAEHDPGSVDNAWQGLGRGLRRRWPHE